MRPLILAALGAALATPAAAQGLLANKYMDPAEAALPNERQREGCRRIRANPRLKPDDLLPDRQMRQGAINCALAAGRAYLADPFAAIPPDPSAPSLRVTCVTVTRFTNCRIY